MPPYNQESGVSQTAMEFEGPALSEVKVTARWKQRNVHIMHVFDKFRTTALWVLPEKNVEYHAETIKDIRDLAVRLSYQYGKYPEDFLAGILINDECETVYDFARSESLDKKDVTFFVDVNSALTNAITTILKKTRMASPRALSKPFLIVIEGGKFATLPLLKRSSLDLNEVRAAIDAVHGTTGDRGVEMVDLPDESAMRDAADLHKLEKAMKRSLLPNDDQTKLITIQHPDLFNLVAQEFGVKPKRNKFGQRLRIESNKGRTVVIDCPSDIDFLHAWNNVARQYHSEPLNVVSVFTDRLGPGMVAKPSIYRDGEMVTGAFWGDMWRNVSTLNEGKLNLEDEHRDRRLDAWSTAFFDETSLAFVVGNYGGSGFTRENSQFDRRMAALAEELARFVKNLSDSKDQYTLAGHNLFSRYLGLTRDMVVSTEIILVTDKSAFGAVSATMRQTELFNADPFTIMIGEIGSKKTKVTVVLCHPDRPNMHAVVSDFKALFGGRTARIVFVGRGRTTSETSSVVLPTGGVFTAVPQQNPDRNVEQRRFTRLSCMPIHQRLTQCITGDQNILKDLRNACLEVMGADQIIEGIVTGLDSCEREMFVGERDVSSLVVAKDCKGLYDVLEDIADGQNDSILVNGLFVTGVDCMSYVANALYRFYSSKSQSETNY